MLQPYKSPRRTNTSDLFVLGAYVPTAGAQAILMDYPQGERAITHHAGLLRIGAC
jgi:hypothetical protein